MPNPKLQGRRDREAQERRRLNGMRLVHEGVSPSEVARRVGVIRQAVYQWIAAERAGGKKALRSKGKPGPKSGPDQKTRERIEAVLLKGPTASGYRNDLWTLRRVGEVIGRITGKKPSTTRTWTLLREMGWSCQRPERRARQRDETRVRDFVHQVWKAVKKTPNAGANASFSPTKAD